MKPKYNTTRFRNQTLGASIASTIVVCLAGSAFAADNLWTGTTSSDWNTTSNWSLGILPLSPDDAVINVKSPNIATITTNPSSVPRDFRVGQGAGADGQLNHTSGSATTGSGNWAFVGRNGGTGVYNLANTAGSGGALTSYAQGSGSFTCNGSRLYVGGGDSGAQGGNGTFNMNTSGSLTIGNDLVVGVSTGAVGTLNVDSGSITTGGWNFIGKNENGAGGSGTLNMSGGTLTNNGGITFVGNPGCTGTVNLNGGSYINNNDRFYVGGTFDDQTWYGSTGGTGYMNVTNSASQLKVGGEFTVGNRGGTGTLTLSDGTITTNSWVQIGRNYGTGTFTMTGGTFTKNGGNHFVVADWGSTGVFAQSGGALSINGEVWVGQGGSANGTYTHTGGTISNNSWVAVGRGSGTGTVNMSGGTWTKTNAGTAFIVGASGPGTFNLSGGLVDVQAGDTWMAEGNTCNFTLSATGEFRATYFQVARNGGSTGNVNLNGGTLRANQIVGGSGTEHVSFNGTQIVAKQTQPNFIGGMDAAGAVIDAGGLKVDSAGFTLDAPQILSGAGGVVKSGAGKLTLSGFNTYTGSNTVNSGELVLRARVDGSGTGDFSVADGTAIGVSAAYVNDKLTPVNATFGTSGTTSLNLDMGNVNGTNFTNSIVDVTGNLVLNGNVTVNVSGSKFAAGTMPLVSYVPGFKTGAGNFVLGTLPNGVVATLVDDTVNGLVYLNITSVALPEWDGTNVAKYLKAGDTSTGLFDVTVSDVTNIAVGQKAFGVGIPAGATVTAISGFTVTLDQAATETSTGITVIFSSGTGTNDGVWDVNTTQNWVDQVTTNLSVFKNANPVLFSDLATGPTAVTLDTTVSPSETVFNNNIKVYSLSGTGKITGTSTLTKLGTESLTISTTNDYTGVTTLSGGTTNVATLTNAGVASPLGAATAAASNLVLSGSTLNYTGATVSIDRGFSTGGLDGAISVPSGTDLTISGPVTASVGSSFNKQGDGSLILSNSSVTLGASGQVNEILAGTLKLTGPGQTVSIPGELWVGSVPAAAGHLILDNTSLTVGGWFTLGRGNGDTGLLSTITATNSTVVCGNFSTGYDNGLPNDSDQTVTLTGTSFTTNGATYLGERANTTNIFSLDAGSVYNANGRFLTSLGTGSVCTITVQGTLNHTAEWMSVGNSNNAVCTMTVKNSGMVNSSGDFNVGDVDTSNGTLNLQDSGKVTSTGNVFIGKNGTTGTVNMTGASIMISAETNVGGNGSSHGNLNIAGTAAFTSNGRLQVGPGGGSVGSVVVEGSSSLTVNSFTSVGFNGGGSMLVKDSGSFNNIDDFSVNENGDVPATVTLQDNSTTAVGRTIYIGRNTTRVGTLNVTGAATLNQTGTAYSLIVGGSGTGTLNISGTSFVSVAATAGVVLTNNASGTATVNLDGGTLTATKVSDAGGNSTFNFNGGVLKAASGADLNFMSGLDNVKVKTGGAFIDSNGQTIAIGQAIGDLGGNLTKQGAGTLQLNGANTYFGTTTVAAGTLGGTGSVAGELVVSSGASIDPGAAGVGTFTVEDNIFVGSSIAGTYVCEISGATADKLAIGDALDITGATLDINELSAPSAGVYIIASYGSLTGTFATVQDLPSGYTLDYNYGGANQIALVQTATPYSTWASSFGLNPLTDGAPTADPDGDGQANSIEFALGGSPVSGSNNAKIFSLTADSSADGDTTDELLLTIAVRSGTPTFAGSPSPSATQDGFTYTIEGSTTLSSFTTTVTPVTTIAPPAPNATAPAGYEYRTFSLSGSNGLPDRGFMRVKITN